MWFFVSLWLQEVLGYSPIRAASWPFLPMTCASCRSMLASRLVSRFGAKRLLLTGMVLLTAGMAMLPGLSPHGTYLARARAPAAGGHGHGTRVRTATISAVAGWRPPRPGLASGLVNTSRLLVARSGLAILAAIATARTTHQLHGRHRPSARLSPMASSSRSRSWPGSRWWACGGGVRPPRRIPCAPPPPPPRAPAPAES